MTRHDFLTAVAHSFVAIGIQLTFWLIGGWSLLEAAPFPLAFIYGREVSQEGRKAADRLMIEHDRLWTYPREALMCLWPGNWGKANQLDFYLPMLSVAVVCFIGFWAA